jgi:hypothetical protein
VIRGFSRSTVSTIQRFNVAQHFSRNEPPNPAKYSGERPEMNFSRREITEGQNTRKGN